MNKRYFIVVAIIHVLFALIDLKVYDYTQQGDSQRYITIANEFAGFTTDFDAGEHCYAAPGYPLFLALLKPFTRHNLFLIALFQAVIFAATLLYLLLNLYKQKYISSVVFAVAYPLVLFYPEIFQSNGLTLTESLCGSSLLFIFGFITKKEWKTYEKVLFFVFIGLLFLTRMEYLLCLPIIVVPLLFDKKYKLIASTAFLLVCLFSLNAYKNHLIFNKLNFFSFGGGTVIYGGNNLNGDGSWHFVTRNLDYFPKDKHPVHENLQTAYTECISNNIQASECYSCYCIKEDSFLKVMAVDAWKESWANQVKIIPLKFMKLWVLPASMDFHTSQIEYKPNLGLGVLFDGSIYPWYAKYKHGFYMAIHWSYLLFIFSGMLIYHFKANSRIPNYYALALFFIVSLMYSIPFYGLGRFHIPILGLLSIYAAVTLEYLDLKYFNTFVAKKISSLAWNQEKVS